MKVNIKKLDEFLLNDQFDQEIKDFILKIVKESLGWDYYLEHLTFFEFIEENGKKTQGRYAIDFLKLNLLESKELKKIILDALNKLLFESFESYEMRNDYERFLLDSKILVKESDIEQVKRKYKLNQINNINEED